MAKKKNLGMAYLNLVMFFLSLTFFGGSGISLAVMGISPIVCLSLLTVFAGSYSPLATAAVSLSAGIVADSVSVNGYCFNAVTFLLFGVSANLLAEYIFNRNLKATAVLCFMLTCFYYLAYWVLFYAFDLGFKDSMRYLLQWCAPSAAYTAILTVPFYLLYKKSGILYEDT